MLWGALLSLSFTACMDIGPEPELCKGGDCEYAFYNDATIEVWEGDPEDGSGDTVLMGTHVVGGFNRVFEIIYTYNDAPGIDDDELTETVRFEVSQDLAGDFVLETEEELNDANAYFSRICYCIGPLAFPLRGRIEGTEKSSTEYEITADLEYEDRRGEVQQVQFTRTFLKANLDN